MAFTAVNSGPGVPVQPTAFATTVVLCVPVQPAVLFAVMVYLPAARLLNVPDAWKVPLFILNVKPLLPVAVAVMLPLETPASAAVTVVLTTMVTPVHGSVGVVVPPPLLHAIK